MLILCTSQNQPMPVLVVHNAYQQRGGEDTVVDAEVALLRAHGHAVTVYRRSNHDIAQMSPATVAMQALWSRRTSQDIAALIHQHRPAVVHVHNSFPLVSPSVYWAAARQQVPVVQTLHNFRLLCPQALLWRDDKPCEDCVGHVPWRAVQHGCYRGSRAQSAAVAMVLQGHRWLGTWQHKISRYIALNAFCRDRFIAGGLPAERIDIKPHFVESVLPPAEPAQRAGFLFVGRLAPEKGIATLLEATRLAGPDCRLRVVGDGPERWRLQDQPQVQVQVQALGALPREQVMAELSGALAVVVPSLSYESFPMVIAEAFACGTPVICSRIGALVSLVEVGHTGWQCEPGNASDLAARLRWAMANPEALRAAGERASAYHTEHLTPQRNYGQLQAIYAQAMADVAAQHSA